MDYIANFQAARRFEDKIQKSDQIRAVIISVLGVLKDEEMSNVKTSYNENSNGLHPSLWTHLQEK